MNTDRPDVFSAARGRRQRGTVLIVSLIILAVMLISAAALVRSFDTTLGTAGNLAFKRDLAQQSERASNQILALFRTGDYRNRAYRATNRAADNYSAVVLPSNPQGIPTALLTNTPLGNAITERGITLHYLIDRMCTSEGDDRLFGAEGCTLAGSTLAPGCDVIDCAGNAAYGSAAATGGGVDRRGAAPQPVVYRISIRATGPRNTQAFFQTTFSCCDD